MPADQLDMVQKYIGNDSQAPKLNKLGGGEWQRAKNKVRQAVADMAEELLLLYSAREAVQRPDFGPDTPWQQEFEDSFPYAETTDQLQAASEIKADMEKPAAHGPLALRRCRLRKNRGWRCGRLLKRSWPAGR